MEYHFLYFKDEQGGFWAKCVELDGCQSEGDNMNELKENLSEALHLYLDEPIYSKTKFSLPDPVIKGDNIINIPVNPKTAFAVVLRLARIERGMTQGQTAKLMGLKTQSYQRLEKTSNNPQLSTMIKVKKIFPDIKIASII